MDNKMQLSIWTSSPIIFAICLCQKGKQSHSYPLTLLMCLWPLWSMLASKQHRGGIFYRWMRTDCWLKSCAKDFHTGALEIHNDASNFLQLWINVFLLFCTVHSVEFGVFQCDLRELSLKKGMKPMKKYTLAREDHFIKCVLAMEND